MLFFPFCSYPHSRLASLTENGVWMMQWMDSVCALLPPSPIPKWCSQKCKRDQRSEKKNGDFRYPELIWCKSWAFCEHQICSWQANPSAWQYNNQREPTTVTRVCWCRDSLMITNWFNLQQLIESHTVVESLVMESSQTGDTMPRWVFIEGSILR